MRFYEFEAKKLLAKQGVRLPEGGTAATPAEARHLAAEINGPVWQADRSGPRRFPLADYIARRMPGFFDLLIVDEQHEYKGPGLGAGARRWFAQARTVLEEDGQRALRAVVDYDEALMYTRRAEDGDNDRAIPLLDAAMQQFNDIGMTGWMRQAEELRASMTPPGT
jgi:hypothetical protein